MPETSQIKSGFKKAASKTAAAVKSLQQNINEFSDQFDRNVTPFRIFTVLENLLTDISDTTYFDGNTIAAAPILGGVVVLSVLGMIVKQIQADDHNEVNHPYHLLLSMLREANRISDMMLNDYDTNCSKAMKEQLFADLGLKQLPIIDAEEEFDELEKYLFFANPGVSRVRRLARRALAGSFFAHKSTKSFAQLDKFSQHYEDYIYGERINDEASTTTSTASNDGAATSESKEPKRKNNGLLANIKNEQQTRPTPSVKGKDIAANDADYESDSDEKADLLAHTPHENPAPKAIKLNAWERFVKNVFFTSGDLHDLGMESEAPTSFIGKTYLKIKNTITNIWVEGGVNYPLYYWVTFASLWLIIPAAIANPLSMGAALALTIPMAPAIVAFITKPFRSAPIDRKTAAEMEAQKAAQEIFFAKSHVRMLRFAYEKLYEHRIDTVKKLAASQRTSETTSPGKHSSFTESEDKPSSNTYSVNSAEDPAKQVSAKKEAILNKKHARWKEVKKRLVAFRFFDALKLAAQLTIKSVYGKYEVNADYKSPAQLVLERLQAKHRTHHNIALSVVSGVLNGGIMASFASWPLTGILVFAGVSAAGGPLAGLICYGVSALIGAFFGVTNGTKASIRAKQEKARIEQLAGTANRLIQAEKETEALRIKLKNRYQKAVALYGAQEEKVKLLKPVLSKKDLVTDANMDKNKTTQGTSLLKRFESVASRVVQGVAHAQAGILISRFLVYSGGVFALLGQLGVIGSLGTSLPITILVSCALMYSGIRLHEYCRKIQERKDFKVLEQAGAKLEVVLENKLFLEQQLRDQKQFMQLLKADTTNITAREAKSVPLILKTINATNSKAKDRRPTNEDRTRLNDEPEESGSESKHDATLTQSRAQTSRLFGGCSDYDLNTNANGSTGVSHPVPTSVQVSA